MAFKNKVGEVGVFRDEDEITLRNFAEDHLRETKASVLVDVFFSKTDDDAFFIITEHLSLQDNEQSHPKTNDPHQNQLVLVETPSVIVNRLREQFCQLKNMINNLDQAILPRYLECISLRYKECFSTPCNDVNTLLGELERNIYSLGYPLSEDVRDKFLKRIERQYNAFIMSIDSKLPAGLSRKKEETLRRKGLLRDD